jgi:hypothetical protein
VSRIGKPRGAQPKPKTVRDPQYLEWLRRRPCVFCKAPPPSEASHHGKRGMGLKPSDHEALPLCRVHHQRWHDKGSPHPIWDDLPRDEKRERLRLLAADYRYTYLHAQPSPGMRDRLARLLARR